MPLSPKTITFAATIYPSNKNIMKKVLLAVMAVAAIGFTACNNKTENGGPAIDSTSLVAEPTAEELAGIDADNLTKELGEKILTKNPEAMAAVMQKAQARIAELKAAGDTLAAKVYQEKVSIYLKENAEQIKTVAGTENDAVITLVNSITAIPGQTVDAVNGTVDAVEGTVDAVKKGAETKVNEVKEDARKKANDAVDAQKKKAADAIDNAAADAKKRLGL